MTKKEKEKEVRQLLFKDVQELEHLIKSSQLSNLSESLFFVAKIETLAKSYSETLRFARVVCYCGCRVSSGFWLSSFAR